ncbi:hypothetical protein [Desulfogranum marinum]|uniref:hypothetical protein n=1 Tax=Desulfogranum marinum TaxID=453220 RepID=UPI0019636D00|nr:hypothetical protein [Desulfogranum marinum]MBM9511787.1 hypothetical protein [Desulfogranum marinum]
MLLKLLLALLSVLIMAFEMVQDTIVLDKESYGPAPNSGDGISDGSGFEDDARSSKRK